MPSPSQNDRSSPQTPSELESIESEFSQLRDLLLAPERSELDELRERLSHPVVHAHDISSLLPDALALRGKQDPELTAAIRPYVEEGLRTSVRKAPQAVADAIAPVMFSAMRQALAKRLSPLTLRWRLESWWTRKPFDEVVSLYTMRDRAEQLFLIHRETNTLLLHVTSDPDSSGKHDIMSEILPAIRSFMAGPQDRGPEAQADQFRLGELTVWVVSGPKASLAAIILGNPSQRLCERLELALEGLHAEAAGLLGAFDGETAPFRSYSSRLRECLDGEPDTPSKGTPRTVWGLALCAAVGLGGWGYLSYQEHLRWTNLLDRLRDEPGLVVTSTEKRDGQLVIAGLREPLAVDPEGLITEAGFDSDEIRSSWAPYYSLDDRFIATRLRQRLNPPRSVTLSVEDQSVTVSGTASEDWAREAQKLALLVPGVDRYRDDNLRTLSFPELVKKLTSIKVVFESGSSRVGTSESAKIDTVKSIIGDLNELAQQEGKTLSIDVIGSADGQGPESMNLLLGMARAQSVVAAIGESDLDSATELRAGVAPPRSAISSRRSPDDPPIRHVAFSVSEKK